jgi:hypothetical protein
MGKADPETQCPQKIILFPPWDGLTKEAITYSEIPQEPFEEARIRGHIEIESVQSRIAQIGEYPEGLNE